MSAILVSEKFGVPPDQLRNMTVTMFWAVYNHPKNDDHTLKRAPRVRSVYKSEKQEFLEFWEARRYTLPMIREKWAESERQRTSRG